MRLLSFLRFSFYCSLIAGVSYIGIVYALNTMSTGYQVTSGQVMDITLADTSCKKITNNATNRFIPTKTMAEWNSFSGVAVSQGVTIGSCAVNCVGSWSNTSTCSASCGGGVLLQSYTITTPASGGGTACPYTNGATQWGGTSCNTQGCAVNCVGSWVDNGTCSTSCGGGVYQQTYVVSTPASGGGIDCPYSNGITQWGGTSCNTQACAVNGSCGGSANSCSAGSPSGYTAGACDGNQTWNCLGSGGGSSASCSIANGACLYNYGACFVAGTQVTLDSGKTKSIEDVKLGEMIRTYDEKTKTFISRPVKEVFHHEERKSILLTFTYGGKTVTSNDIHPFYLPKEDTYKHAIDIYNLWINHTPIYLLSEDGKIVEVTHISKMEKVVPLYNLHVVGVYDNTGNSLFDHNYFANGVLVHNVKMCWNEAAGCAEGSCTFGSPVQCTGTAAQRDGMAACFAAACP